MDSPYHIEITTQALRNFVGDQALKAILAANLKQDRLLYLLIRPQFHFDEQVAPGLRYMQEQRRLLLRALRQEQWIPAWQAFGRLIHAAQDFYSHSSYVHLWIAKEQKRQPGKIPPVESIDPLDPTLLDSPKLTCGKIYLQEGLVLIPRLEPLARRLLPRDAHYWVHLDHPGRGALFPYACTAARKRTRYEFEETLTLIQAELGKATSRRFCAMQSGEQKS